MIKKGIIVSLFLLSTLLIACGNSDAQQEGNSTISGQLTGLTSQQLYLIDLVDPKKGPVDTAIVDADGNFSFDYQPPMKGFYRISLSQSINLILPLASGEKITVNGNASGPSTIFVKGTQDVERMMEFNQFLQQNYMKQQALNQEFQTVPQNANKDSIMLVFRNRYEAIEAEKHALIRKMIDQDASLFANIALMEQLPAEDMQNVAYYVKVRDALADQYGASPFYQGLDQKTQQVSRFMPGSDVPEINLPNPDGNLIPLSSLRGKVVLIDFWASWCKPCRMENPNVVAAYQKYKDKGFTVYGVSLDRNKEAWVKAIQQDNLTWTHVSDLKFWQSEAARAYGVSGIPFALLIDQDGKVIGKNLRGQKLFNTLEKVLN